MVKKGAFVSTLGSALPSFVTILVFAFFLSKYQDSPALQKMLKAVRPAVRCSAYCSARVQFGKIG